MSQQPPDEEFERRLRDLLRSRELGVPVPADAVERIHAGARRRQQRRSASAALGAVAVIAIVAGAIGLNGNGGHGPKVAANVLTASPTVVETQSAAPLRSSTPAASTSALTASSPAATPPSPAVPSVAQVTPTAYPSAGSPVPADFTPISVTAVNDKTFWVLGRQRCGHLACTAIVRTTDAGAHFNEVAAPHVATTNLDNNTWPGFNLRFADSSNGWAYGDALWTTADGGVTWSDTSLPAGSVEDLEAARDPGSAAGTVWAVVAPVPLGAGYQLWEAPYATGSGTGTWQRVNLGTDPPAGSAPSLVVKGATAYLFSYDANDIGHMYVASVGAATRMYAAPCVTNISPVSVSAGVGSLWAACPGGASVSTDGGATWHTVATPSGGEVGIIGGIDATSAVVSQGVNLYVVSKSGEPTLASVSSLYATFSFLGFTDAKVGYVLSHEPNCAGRCPYAVPPNRLWRTTDGGLTWKIVTF